MLSVVVLGKLLPVGCPREGPVRAAADGEHLVVGTSAPAKVLKGGRPVVREVHLLLERLLELMLRLLLLRLLLLVLLLLLGLLLLLWHLTLDGGRVLPVRADPHRLCSKHRPLHIVSLLVGDLGVRRGRERRRPLALRGRGPLALLLLRGRRKGTVLSLALALALALVLSLGLTDRHLRLLRLNRRRRR